MIRYNKTQNMQFFYTILYKLYKKTKKPYFTIPKLQYAMLYVI